MAPKAAPPSPNGIQKAPQAISANRPAFRFEHRIERTGAEPSLADVRSVSGGTLDAKGEAWQLPDTSRAMERPEVDLDAAGHGVPGFWPGRQARACFT